MSVDSILHAAIVPALRLLPGQMDAPVVRVLLLAIGLQESGLQHRFQLVAGARDLKGPARGLWQFEEGDSRTRGGVWGICTHSASKHWLEQLCAQRKVKMNPSSIHSALEFDDVLAAGVARLLLWTDARVLPALDDELNSWQLYLRTWRPGAYTRGSETQRALLRNKWAGFFREASAFARRESV